MEVIGIHGPSRSGKDTICKILVDKFPMIKFERQGFADALKVSAAKSIGLNGSASELVAKMDALKEEGQIHTPWGKISGREFLQHYGTEAHRDMFGSDFWLNQVIPNPTVPKARFAGIHRTCDALLIPDVRYQNEVGRIIDASGKLWQVRRGNLEKHMTGHASEGKLKVRWDAVIDNNETIDDLKRQVVLAFTPIANEILNKRIKRVVGVR
jgi:hypothetical protein